MNDLFGSIKPVGIGIVGSRRRANRQDMEILKEKFFEIYDRRRGDFIVSGGCPQGADYFAEKIAFAEEIPIRIYYAAWKVHGKGAGMIRNTWIARDADVLLALPAQNRTGGTEDTIHKAKEMGKKVILL